MSRPKIRARVLDADPFDISTAPTPAQLSWAQWFVDITKDISGQYHIRRVHYRTLGKPKPNGVPYDNSPADWERLVKASLYARYLELVGFDRIIDHKNEGVVVTTTYAPDELDTELNIVSRCLRTSQISDLYDILNDSYLQGTIQYDVQSRQPCHIEIWVEKSTLNDILVPIAKRYGATLVVAGGQFSATNVKDCFHRIKGLDKPVIIFYLRDFDPGGDSMPKAVSRKLEWFIRKEKPRLDVKLLDVALTYEQCVEFKLPRTPLERSEAYMGNFEMKYGKGVTELDSLEALYPGKLAEILIAAIEPYFDGELEPNIIQFSDQEHDRYEEHVDSIVNSVIEDLEDELQPLVDRFNEAVDKANEIGQEIEDIVDSVEINEEDAFEPELPERSNHVVNDTNTDRFLLDTYRDYESQLKIYELLKPPKKKQKRKRVKSKGAHEF